MSPWKARRTCNYEELNSLYLFHNYAPPPVPLCLSGTCLWVSSGILTIGGKWDALRHTPALQQFGKFGSSASVWVKPNQAEQTEPAQWELLICLWSPFFNAEKWHSISTVRGSNQASFSNIGFANEDVSIATTPFFCFFSWLMGERDEFPSSLATCIFAHRRWMFDAGGRCILDCIDDQWANRSIC